MSSKHLCSLDQLQSFHITVVYFFKTFQKYLKKAVAAHLANMNTIADVMKLANFRTNSNYASINIKYHWVYHQ